jgi:uncharacterized protein (TIGR03086 family)
MAGQPGAARSPSGATALLAGAISYALTACAQVEQGEMTRPTPCPDWDLGALLAHLAASMADLESAIQTGHLDLDPDDREVPAAGGDPAEVVRDRAANLLYACYAYRGRDRFVVVGGVPLPVGIVNCVGAVEIAVHGWDVSASRGRFRPIPRALASRMLRMCPLLIAGREGLFGAPVRVSSQASPGDRLVACLGRNPDPAAPEQPAIA